MSTTTPGDTYRRRTTQESSFERPEGISFHSELFPSPGSFFSFVGGDTDEEASIGMQSIKKSVQKLDRYFELEFGASPVSQGGLDQNDEDGLEEEMYGLHHSEDLLRKELEVVEHVLGPSLSKTRSEHTREHAPGSPVNEEREARIKAEAADFFRRLLSNEDERREGPPQQTESKTNPTTTATPIMCSNECEVLFGEVPRNLYEKVFDDQGSIASRLLDLGDHCRSPTEGCGSVGEDSREEATVTTTTTVGESTVMPLSPKSAARVTVTTAPAAPDDDDDDSSLPKIVSDKIQQVLDFSKRNANQQVLDFSKRKADGAPPSIDTSVAATQPRRNTWASPRTPSSEYSTRYNTSEDYTTGEASSVASSPLSFLFDPPASTTARLLQAIFPVSPMSYSTATSATTSSPIGTSPFSAASTPDGGSSGYFSFQKRRPNSEDFLSPKSSLDTAEFLGPACNPLMGWNNAPSEDHSNGSGGLRRNDLFSENGEYMESTDFYSDESDSSSWLRYAITRSRLSTISEGDSGGCSKSTKTRKRLQTTKTEKTPSPVLSSLPPPPEDSFPQVQKDAMLPLEATLDASVPSLRSVTPEGSSRHGRLAVLVEDASGSVFDGLGVLTASSDSVFDGLGVATDSSGSIFDEMTTFSKDKEQNGDHDIGMERCEYTTKPPVLEECASPSNVGSEASSDSPLQLITVLAEPVIEDPVIRTLPKETAEQVVFQSFESDIRNRTHRPLKVSGERAVVSPHEIPVVDSRDSEVGKRDFQKRENQPTVTNFSASPCMSPKSQVAKWSAEQYVRTPTLSPQNGMPSQSPSIAPSASFGSGRKPPRSPRKKSIGNPTYPKSGLMATWEAAAASTTTTTNTSPPHSPKQSKLQDESISSSPDYERITPGANTDRSKTREASLSPSRQAQITIALPEKNTKTEEVQRDDIIGRIISSECSTSPRGLRSKKNGEEMERLYRSAAPRQSPNTTSHRKTVSEIAGSTKKVKSSKKTKSAKKECVPPIIGRVISMESIKSNSSRTRKANHNTESKITHMRSLSQDSEDLSKKSTSFLQSSYERNDVHDISVANEVALGRVQETSAKESIDGFPAIPSKTGQETIDVDGTESKTSQGHITAKTTASQESMRRAYETLNYELQQIESMDLLSQSSPSSKNNKEKNDPDKVLKKLETQLDAYRELDAMKSQLVNMQERLHSRPHSRPTKIPKYSDPPRTNQASNLEAKDDASGPSDEGFVASKIEQEHPCPKIRKLCLHAGCDYQNDYGEIVTKESGDTGVSPLSSLPSATLEEIKSNLPGSASIDDLELDQIMAIASKSPVRSILGIAMETPVESLLREVDEVPSDEMQISGPQTSEVDEILQMNSSQMERKSTHASMSTVKEEEIESSKEEIESSILPDETSTLPGDIDSKIDSSFSDEKVEVEEEPIGSNSDSEESIVHTLARIYTRSHIEPSQDAKRSKLPSELSYSNCNFAKSSTAIDRTLQRISKRIQRASMETAASESKRDYILLHSNSNSAESTTAIDSTLQRISTRIQQASMERAASESTGDSTKPKILSRKSPSPSRRDSEIKKTPKKKSFFSYLLGLEAFCTPSRMDEEDSIVDNQYLLFSETDDFAVGSISITDSFADVHKKLSPRPSDMSDHPDDIDQIVDSIEVTASEREEMRILVQDARMISDAEKTTGFEEAEEIRSRKREMEKRFLELPTLSSEKRSLSDAQEEDPRTKNRMTNQWRRPENAFKKQTQEKGITSNSYSNCSEEEKLLRCNDLLLHSIIDSDFATYQSLVSSSLTGIDSPQVDNAIQPVLRKNQGTRTAAKVSMMNPTVRFLSDETAFTSYIRIDQYADGSIIQSKETRIWELRQPGNTWINCHYHQS